MAEICSEVKPKICVAFKALTCAVVSSAIAEVDNTANCLVPIPLMAAVVNAATSSEAKAAACAVVKAFS